MFDILPAISSRKVGDFFRSEVGMLNEARKIETRFKTEYSKSIFQNRNSISHFLFFSPVHAKVQTNKQTNLRSPAGRTRSCITGIGVCSSSIESAIIQTNRKLRWFDSWVFDVRGRCTSAHFPVNRAATTHCDRRSGREVVKVRRDLRRLWWRWQLSERHVMGNLKI